MKNFKLAATAAVTALLLPVPALAQLAISVNDGKQLQPGQTSADRTADNVSVIDMSQNPPRIIGTVLAPTSMIGPPTSVALAPDESFALATAAQGIENDRVVRSDDMTVIDLSDPTQPRVVQMLSAGAGATGVAINRTGTLALAAGTGSDAIAVFTVRDGRLTPAGQVRLDYQSRLTDVAFSPDGRTALAVAQSANKIVRLDVNGDRVTRTDVEISPGLSPYGVVVSPDSRYAYNTNLGGRLPQEGEAAPTGPRIGSVSVIDLQSNAVVHTVDVGITPEHVALSQDGNYLAVVLLNGSNAAPTSPNYNAHGIMKVFRTAGPSLELVAEISTGQWCQGAAWTPDNSRILLQCAMSGEIEVYDFSGQSLNRADTTLQVEGRPGALSVAAVR